MRIKHSSAELMIDEVVVPSWRSVRIEQMDFGGQHGIHICFSWDHLWQSGDCPKVSSASGAQQVQSEPSRLYLSSCKKPDPPKTPSTPRITTFPQVPITCDAVRNKCREMLTLALQTDREYYKVWIFDPLGGLGLLERQLFFLAHCDLAKWLRFLGSPQYLYLGNCLPGLQVSYLASRALCK